MLSRVAALNRDLGEEVRQRSLNVAGRTFDSIPPASGNSVDEKRTEIKRYLTERLATSVKVAKRGKRKGRFMQKGGRLRQLQRVHLIVNARRGKAGKKGRYGRGMMETARFFKNAAENSVGFLKSTLLPIITTLNPLCRFKFPFLKTKNISRWPNSAGYGKASINTSAQHPGVLMEFGAKVKKNDGKIQSIMDRATNAAISAEANEIEKHMRERMDKLARKFNSER
jgi:hypothetical protein